MRLSKLAFAIALASVAVAAAAAAADPDRVRLQGKVRDAAADLAAFDLEEKGAEKAPPWKVSLADVGEVLLHKTKKLKEIESGTLHVLGRWIPGQRKVKPRVADVVAIVVTPDNSFQPPVLTKDQEARKLQWITGPLAREGGTVRVQGANLDAGAERLVTIVELGRRESIEKGKPVLVEAVRPDPKARELKAERVSVLAAETPAAELKLILGL